MFCPLPGVSRARSKARAFRRDSHILPAPRRLAGAEQGSGVSEVFLNPRCGRVRAAKYAPRSPCHVLERCHGLADIVERGAVVVVERLRVIHPHSERDFMTLPKNALRRGQYFAQHRLGFFEAL